MSTQYLRDVWYMAAFRHEVAPDKVLARTIIELPLIFWETADGQISALMDRCSHRLVPLSLGHLEDDEIRCGYHGLKFDRNGECVENPHGKLSNALCVPAFPVVERHKMIWIWLGAKDKANPADIPDLSFIDETKPTAFFSGYLSPAADHRLIADNLLDSSHADFLHPDTLGGWSRAVMEVKQRPDGLLATWLISGEPAIPLFRPLMPTPETPVDGWVEIEWRPSGVITLFTGCTPVGQPRSAGVEARTAHLLTPKDATNTHYFYGGARNYAVDSEEFNQAMGEAIRYVFSTQDLPMIEAQQRLIGNNDLADLRTALLPTDRAGIKARRIYAELLANADREALASSVDTRELVS